MVFVFKEVPEELRGSSEYGQKSGWEEYLFRLVT